MQAGPNDVCNGEKWPVIIHSAFQSTDVFALLNTTHKVRGISKYIYKYV